MAQPLVMGILNVTSDSFSDGGKFQQLDRALFHVEQMISGGADIIDIGGESTRPGAQAVSLQQELDVVMPILEAIHLRFDVVISVDTSKAQVMQHAISSGADLINDVRALQNEGCLEVLAKNDIPVCLMHMQGLPENMQQKPSYQDVVQEISDFFQQRISACEQAGIMRERLILDPGFGFGKTLQQNYLLLKHLAAFKSFGLPILSGTSRKSMIGNLLQLEVEQRLVGSVTTALLAVQQGANIVRVHDVAATKQALTLWQATSQAEQYF